MNYTTTELLNKIKSETNIIEYIKNNQNEFTESSFHDLLHRLARKKGLALSEIVKKSGQGDYVYKIFKGTRKPSRDTIIAISIGMQADFEESNQLLNSANFSPLHPRTIRDSIIIYALAHHLTIYETNDILFELNEKTL